MKNRNETIVQYYDDCEQDYKLFWDLERSSAMHAGYWDKTTSNLHEALMRENEILAQMAQIKETDHVLDAGCGVGGSSIFLMEHYHCKVTGITLSRNQVDKARHKAQKKHFKSPPNFLVRDFCETGFPDAFFDVVWGIESVCHAEDKSQFIREAYRVLKPGGRIIIADGFMNSDSLTEEESFEMSKWLNGWGVHTLEMADNFHGFLAQYGFQNIIAKDVTSHVMPSSRRLYYISFPAYLLSKLGEFVGMRSKNQTANIKGAYYQYKTLRKELWKYWFFYAIKP